MVYFFATALWISLTVSTTGIIKMARPIATAYSVMSMVVKPTAFARKGTSMTVMVGRRLLSQIQPGESASL